MFTGSINNSYTLLNSRHVVIFCHIFKLQNTKAVGVHFLRSVMQMVMKDVDVSAVNSVQQMNGLEDKKSAP